MQQVFHTWIWGSSAIPPCRSSPDSVRLDGKRWWTAIFRSLQRCWIGFKSGLWLGHSRTVTELLWSHSFVILAVCLGSLSCWKVNLQAQSEVLSTLEKVFVQDIPVLGQHSSFPRLQPVVLSLQLKNTPTAWCCHHHASLLGLYWTGDEQCLFFSTHTA